MVFLCTAANPTAHADTPKHGHCAHSCFAKTHQEVNLVESCHGTLPQLNAHRKLQRLFETTATFR